MKILLVDDDSFLRDMYATKFTQEGFEVTVARNGEEAQLFFKEQSPFVAVLLDMVMPGISGIELIKHLQQQLGGKAGPKFIVLSNQGEELDIKTAIEAGAHGYIVKAEALPSEVVERVKVILEKP